MMPSFLGCLYCAGRLQGYHPLFVPYKEDTCCLLDKACAEWDGGADPPKSRSHSKEKKKKKIFLGGSFSFPVLFTPIGFLSSLFLRGVRRLLLGRVTAAN